VPSKLEPLGKKTTKTAQEKRGEKKRAKTQGKNASGKIWRMLLKGAKRAQPKFRDQTRPRKTLVKSYPVVMAWGRSGNKKVKKQQQ